MKKITEYFIVISLFASFLSGGVVLAATKTPVVKQTLEVGTVYRIIGKPGVYTIASDGKGYPFPDEATFFSWVSGYNKIKAYNANQVANVAVKSAIITLKPGARLVRFGEETKVYLVTQGARLRWVRTEAIAHEMFGDNWQKNYLVSLPLNRKKDYVLSADITSADQVDRVEERSVTIAQELLNRKVVKIVKTNTKQPTLDIVGLKSLKENITAALNPSFAPAVNYYYLKAKYSEDKITLTPESFNSSTQTIYVNDYAVPNKTAITLDLPVGDLDIPIRVKSSKEESKYTVKVTREEPSENTYLASLTENLSGSFSSKFSKSTRDYTMEATGKELSMKVVARVEDSKSRLFVDGHEVSSGSSYEKGLKIGLNVVQFVVLSESGVSDRYTITVRKVN